MNLERLVYKSSLRAFMTVHVRTDSARMSAPHKARITEVAAGGRRRSHSGSVINSSRVI